MNYSVMIDIETLGLVPGSVVFSIGVVHFTENEIVRTAKFNIDIENCQELGLTKDPNTIKWWEERGGFDDMQVVIMPLKNALEALSSYITKETKVWSKGSFDIEHLTYCYRLLKLPVPWHYRNTLDLRTAIALAGFESSDFSEASHDSLQDAIDQVKILHKVMEKLK